MRYGKLELTPRLQLLADWIPSGAVFADVGTDHGYLPAWLILHGRVNYAVASDLRQMPLSHAKATAERCGVRRNISFRLGSGLSVVAPEEVDTIVIAGMGGENIAAILSAAPWTADGRHTLLLQPMSRSESLRAFLAERGYAITREQLAEDRDTLYPVMEARGGKMSLSLGQIYGGAALNRDPLGDRYLIEKIVRLTSAVGGMNRSGDAADAQRADSLREIIMQLLQMREEWRRGDSRTN
ncbi:MAG: class I SAM-dependent methyltransferase [Oscillibacter sp.]|jgi:tRNA (adenine22-N1)-methyltransferase|nr:class I SAM-dependent methyltransferase [Oscillibacter sp.]